MTKHNLGPWLLTKVAVAVALTASTQFVLANNSVSNDSRLTESQFKSVMTFTQNYALNGSLTVRSQSGPMTKSNSGYGLERNVQQHTSLKFGGMPRALSAGTGPAATLTQEQALASAKRWAERYIVSSAASMGEELVRIGVGAGIFTYSEEVNISRPNDTPIVKALSFVMTVDRTGRATYGAPVLTALDPDIIHATYTPARAGDEFASEDWRLPHGGTLAYQVLDSKGNAKSALTYLNTAGAYDATAPNGGEMVACLMDKTSTGCSIAAGIPDVKSLMMKHAADMAIVDYTNQVVPVYDEVLDSNGETLYLPRGAVSYTDRIWNCKEYKNEGHYGYVLEVSASRYFGRLESDQTVNYSYQSHYSGTMLSNIKNFSKSVLGSTFTGRASDYIISHLADDNRVLSLTDPMETNLTYIAPVRSVGDPTAFTTANQSGHARLTKVGQEGAQHSFLWSTGNNHSVREGGYSASLSFDLETKEDFAEFGIYKSSIDDWAVVQVNGQPVFSSSLKNLSDVKYVETVDEHGPCIGVSCGGLPFVQSYNYDYSQGYSRPRGYWTGDTAAEIAAMLRIPSVSNWVCGNAVSISDEGGGFTGRHCLANTTRNYASCEFIDTGSDTGTSYFRCSQSAVCGGGAYKVEVTDKTGAKSCYQGDRGSTDSDDYYDLKPALKAGTNTITLSHVVTRTGHSHVYFGVAGCAATSGFDTGPQAAVPPRATPSGVTNELGGKMGIAR